jgi:hypothetical protein
LECEEGAKATSKLLIENREFAYATEAALFADWSRKAAEYGEVVGTVEEFREFMRTNTLAKEVIFEGERCWQFPPLAECRRDFECRHVRGSGKTRTPNGESGDEGGPK